MTTDPGPVLRPPERAARPASACPREEETTSSQCRCPDAWSHPRTRMSPPPSTANQFTTEQTAKGCHRTKTKPSRPNRGRRPVRRHVPAKRAPDPCDTPYRPDRALHCGTSRQASDRRRSPYVTAARRKVARLPADMVGNRVVKVTARSRSESAVLFGRRVPILTAGSRVESRRRVHTAASGEPHERRLPSK